MPSPVEWGWKEKDGKYIADWTDLRDAALGIQDLMCPVTLKKDVKDVVNVSNQNCHAQNFAFANVTVKETDHS